MDSYVSRPIASEVINYTYHKESEQHIHDFMDVIETNPIICADSVYNEREENLLPDVVRISEFTVITVKSAFNQRLTFRNYYRLSQKPYMSSNIWMVICESLLGSQ